MGVAEIVLPQMESISLICQSLEPIKALVNVLYTSNLSCATFIHHALESRVEDYVSILRFCIKRLPQLARIAFKGLIAPEWTNGCSGGAGDYVVRVVGVEQGTGDVGLDACGIGWRNVYGGASRVADGKERLGDDGINYCR